MAIEPKEILEELLAVSKGKTFDAILPPLVFVLANSLTALEYALILSVACGMLLGIRRLVRQQNALYALGGLLGVLAASGFALLTRSAVGYFIPSLLGSAALVLAAVISLAAGRPLAAWASHLTRGWPLEWFWRPDVKPAYREVTWVWAVYFMARLVLLVVLFWLGDALRLAWINSLLGWPVTVLVLIFSYVYGIWRLRSLQGPGVDEYQAGKPAPWRGQTRGF